MVTLSLHIKLDLSDPRTRAAAHAAIDALYNSVPEDLRTVLESFAAGLNVGERAMLRAIAERAPDPLPYKENRRILVSAAKFGNVASCLKRRFASRGHAIPYKTTAFGYGMSEADAAVVLSVLDSVNL